MLLFFSHCMKLHARRYKGDGNLSVFSGLSHVCIRFYPKNGIPFYPPPHSPLSKL